MLLPVLALAFDAMPAGGRDAWPPPLAPTGERADAVRVFKAARRMELLRDGEVIRRYRILLGDTPVGHKQLRSPGKRSAPGALKVGAGRSFPPRQRPKPKPSFRASRE